MKSNPKRKGETGEKIDYQKETYKLLAEERLRKYCIKDCFRCRFFSYRRPKCKLAIK